MPESLVLYAPGHESVNRRLLLWNIPFVLPERRAKRASPAARLPRRAPCSATRSSSSAAATAAAGNAMFSWSAAACARPCARASRPSRRTSPFSLRFRRTPPRRSSPPAAHDVFAPAVTKAVLSPAEREPEHCGAYLRGVSLAAARQFFPRAPRRGGKPLTFIRHEDTLLGVQRGDTAQRLYGAAVDIGTTTVAMYIYDLTTGALLHTGSALNGQIRYGADVIARIQHAIEHKTGLAELNRAILDTIDALLAAASNAVPGLSDDLWQLVFCGNSTMQHLFLGIDPSALGAEPFASVTADTVRAPAGEIGLKKLPRGRSWSFCRCSAGSSARIRPPCCSACRKRACISPSISARTARSPSATRATAFSPPPPPAAPRLRAATSNAACAARRARSTMQTSRRTGSFASTSSVRAKRRGSAAPASST